MQAALMQSDRRMAAAHPNEFDLKRIGRALENRVRYRYVTPRITDIEGGYQIKVPCCSRNVDPDGSIIDVVLLLIDDRGTGWLLFSRDYEGQEWLLHGRFPRLTELLDELNEDPGRAFWQ
ncbi:hypothetical protein [Breoghania sp.]|uniref:DUF3024 domain-containing protein n=1 Tax=Breoghania sp. TaxID=2065378 RepID=UPI002607EF66|nr:hypothetical protein [Breoghania sp.]MDJ0931305.1 hypothetical protein [Breoghania sp.]